MGPLITTVGGFGLWSRTSQSCGRAASFWLQGTDHPAPSPSPRLPVRFSVGGFVTCCGGVVNGRGRRGLRARTPRAGRRTDDARRGACRSNRHRGPFERRLCRRNPWGEVRKGGVAPLRGL